MIAAVFDLDRTLLPETTAERIFLRYLVRKRVLGGAGLVQTVHFMLRSGPGDAIHRIRAERPYLTGMHDAALRLHGRRCALTEILPRLSARGVEVVTDHQASGRYTLLLSGSLPYVVEPLARELQFDEVICSRMKLYNQRLTGQLDGLHPYGESKAKLMYDSVCKNGIDLASSWCYADHHTDEPILSMFGNPVCVNPSDRLRQIATSRGWRIEIFG